MDEINNEKRRKGRKREAWKRRKVWTRRQEKKKAWMN